MFGMMTDTCFMLKFLGPHYFQTLRWIQFLFNTMIDTGPKFYAVLSAPMYMTLINVTDSEFLC